MSTFALKDYPYFKKSLFLIFIVEILNGLYKTIGVFATPPVTKTDYTTAVEAYQTANAAHDAGGKSFKDAADAAYEALLVILDKLLDYVNRLPNLTPLMVQQSGFHEGGLSGGVGTLDQAIFKQITKLGGGAVSIEYKVVKNADNYGMFIVAGGELPVGTTFIDGVLILPEGTNPKIVFNVTKQRVKTFTNLTIGILYYIYCYSSNSSGVSVLSVGTDFTFSNN